MPSKRKASWLAASSSSSSHTSQTQALEAVHRWLAQAEGLLQISDTWLLQPVAYSSTRPGIRASVTEAEGFAAAELVWPKSLFRWEAPAAGGEAVPPWTSTKVDGRDLMARVRRAWQARQVLRCSWTGPQQWATATALADPWESLPTVDHRARAFVDLSWSAFRMSDHDRASVGGQEGAPDDLLLCTVPSAVWQPWVVRLAIVAGLNGGACVMTFEPLQSTWTWSIANLAGQQASVTFTSHAHAPTMPWLRMPRTTLTVHVILSLLRRAHHLTTTTERLRVGCNRRGLWLESEPAPAPSPTAPPPANFRVFVANVASEDLRSYV